MASFKAMDKDAVQTIDVEKASSSSPIDTIIPMSGSSENLSKRYFWHKLYSNGVEMRGGQPIPLQERTDTSFFNVFTVYFTSMFSLLPIGTGMVPTLFYGLSLGNSAALIFIFGFLFTLPACYIITISPRTGMRQMVQGRYSYGYWLNTIQVLITMLTVAGFCIIASSIGGQCLESLSNGVLSQQVGLVLIILPAMCISFAGYKVLHTYGRYGWIPVVFALFCLVGYGTPGLKRQVKADPVTAPAVVNTIALMAGYMISWGNVIGDICVYMPPNAPKRRLFFYSLFGICIPINLLLTFGAAIGAALPNNPTWLAAYDLYSTGGVLGAMLEPAGGFGKFILFIFSFSVIATVSREIYMIANDFQILIPKAHKIPRIVWVIFTAGLIIGLTEGAVQSFYASLKNLINFIGYFSGSYVAVILIEFLCFRKGDPDSYDHAIWEDAKRLPPGIAATIATFVPWALIVPSMDETWYTGPIAKVTGDLGFEVAVILSVIIYIPCRMLEIKWAGRL